jgi:hypothetical protein
MMMDWNQYHKEIGARIGDLMKMSPDTVRGYQTLSAANSKTSKLGEKKASADFSRRGRHHALRRLHRCAYRCRPQSGCEQGRDCRSPRSCRRHERGHRACLFLARARRRGCEISCGPRRLICDTPRPGSVRVNFISDCYFSRNTPGQGA